jgi:ubiquinone/menaquinone biosynthesis C-methylase UbiE
MAQQSQSFTGHHHYSNVDQQAAPTSFVAHLDRITALEQILAYKRQSYALLQIQPGHRILDVGCGTGDDVRAMAEQVGAAGRVVGLDSSTTMIQTAQERTNSANLPVEFQLGDLMQLDFPNATFDGVRADRVLHHITAFEQAFAEMVRVTRSGGRVVIFEPDVDAFLLNSPDKAMTRQVIQTFSDHYPNGQCGRHLYRLYKAAGLQEIGLYAIPFLFTEVELAEQTMNLSHVVKLIATSHPDQADHANRWLADVKQAGRDGVFFCMLLGMLVVGTKA